MKRTLLFCMVVILIVSGCKNHSTDNMRMSVENKLGKKVVCILGYNYPNLKLDFTSKEALLADTNLFLIDTNQAKQIDTLGFCKKDIWNQYVQRSLLMLFVFDAKKLIHAKTLEDALVERYYFSYTQLIKEKGMIVVY